MPKISIIMAYMDGNNSFRRRNLFAVLDRLSILFMDTEIVVAEQNRSSVSERLDTYGHNLRRIQVDLDKRFHKTKLLNAAVEATTEDIIVMVDADSYLDGIAADSLMIGSEMLINGKAGLVYPFDNVDYLTEGQTRRLLSGEEVNSKFCYHGVHIQRQTGLCNMFTRNAWNSVRGFDEDFVEWGAEDDAFAFKLKRKVGPIVRLPGRVYHLWHQAVNTDAYQESATYVRNRKLCACVRRMSDEDFDKYVKGEVTLDSLVEQYEGKKRLSVRLQWPCTKQTLLTIDTTIYDINYEGGISFTKILEAVLQEDGADYIPTFVHDIFDPIPDLTDDQRKEIADFVEKVRPK